MEPGGEAMASPPGLPTGAPVGKCVCYIHMRAGGWLCGTAKKPGSGDAAGLTLYTGLYWLARVTCRVRSR